MSYTWTRALGDDETTTDGRHPSPAHLIPTFESQLTQLQERFARYAWPTFLQIKFAGLKLQVYALALSRSHAYPINRGEPYIPSATDEMLRAKTLSATVTVAMEARKDALNLQYWPVFARFNVLFAASMGVFTAAKTPDEATREPLIEACKNNLQLLRGWALYPRDSFARVTKHLATGIRHIESHGAFGIDLSQAEDRIDRPKVTSRMAASIAFQLIWDAKHGKPPGPAPPTQPAYTLVVQPQISVPQQPLNAANSTVPCNTQLEQAFGYSFGDIDDSMFLEDWTEADFTDIALDWQSMLPASGVSWPPGVQGQL